ncbi:MAG: DUF3179 domain-containing protein [Cyclobacteriaceae bacterium]|nr:DUF3179 domain-containing protein [Cyclobacteriaceae bacterium]
MNIKIYLANFLVILLLVVFQANAQKFVRGKFDPRWKTDTTNTIVNLREFTSLMPRDGFEVFNNPGFINREEALNFYFKFEPVIAIEIEGEARAYPLNVLTFHEIANDEIKGIPIAVTYCPLCNAGIVYDRRFKHKDKEYVFDFAVSGMLRKSDMVMWDKQTETWWQQLTGEGLVGELSGEMLNFLPSLIISVEEFFSSYPDGKIMLSHKQNNYGRTYGSNPYHNYDSLGNQGSRFFDEEVDDRLPAMERVVDIENGGAYKIYPFKKIRKKKVINDDFKGKQIVIFYAGKTISVLDKKNIEDSHHVGTVTVFSSIVDGKRLTFKPKKGKYIDLETESVWEITGKCVEGSYKGKQLVTEVHSNHFAFAWLAFHPESEIFE